MARDASGVKAREMKNIKHTAVPMDKDTGVEMGNTQWSNGLHQFLTLKSPKIDGKNVTQKSSYRTTKMSPNMFFSDFRKFYFSEIF